MNELWSIISVILQIIVFFVGLWLFSEISLRYGRVIFEEENNFWIRQIQSFWTNIAHFRHWRTVTVVCLGIIMIIGTYHVHSTYQALSNAASIAIVNDVRMCAPPPRISTGTTILIIGVDDASIQGTVRSDTIKVVYLAPPDGALRVLSIPRDTQVTIAGIGVSKINAAYTYGAAASDQRFGAAASSIEGGMALAAATVEAFLDVPIDAVIQLDFAGLIQLVDALGGVTINVPALVIDEQYPTGDGGTTQISFEPGEQRMDGVTALMYARTRYGDSDFARNNRQNQVIDALINEVVRQGPTAITALTQAAEAIAGNSLFMTIPAGTLDANVVLAQRIPAILTHDRVQATIEPPTVPIAELDGSNIIWDPVALAALRSAFIDGAAITLPRIKILNGTNQPGLARMYSDYLALGGCAVLEPADAPRDDVTRSVVYSPNQRTNAVAARVAWQLGIDMMPGEPGAQNEADVVTVVLGEDMKRELGTTQEAP